MPRWVQFIINFITALFMHNQAWTCAKCGQAFTIRDRTQPTAAGWCCVCDQFSRPGQSAPAPANVQGIAAMPMHPVTIVSPWVCRFGTEGNLWLITSVAFDDTTRALLTTTITRDVGCTFTTIYIGVGTDGTMETTTHIFRIPVGTTTVTAAQLSANGLSTIEDVLALQISAQP